MSPWFSKEKKKDEQAVASSSRSQSNGNVTTTITTKETIITQRSYSVSSTNSSYQLQVTASLPALPSKDASLDELDRAKKRLSFFDTKRSTDAVPLKSPSSIPTKINLNYQNVYPRNRFPYSSAPVPTPRIASTSAVATSVPAATRKFSVPPPSIVVTPSPPPVSVKKKAPPKKILVKKTGKRYDNDVFNKVPVYKTSSKKRGEVLIVNNVMFTDNSRRHGADIDEKNVAELFRQMGFEVKKKRDLKKSEMERTIKDFSRSSSLKSVDVSVVVVMSHGTNRQILGGYTEVFGVDEKGLATDHILEFFATEKCPHMAGKPKIFIFQCCRGDNQEFVQSDAKPFKTKSSYADMLIAHSTLPGFVSYRDATEGTYYIQTICDVFQEHAHEHHVEDMLKIVDTRLDSKQTTTYESRGFKRCYFHP